MRLAIVASAAFILASHGATPATARLEQPAPQPHISYVDYDAPPKTLEKLCASVTVIARVEIEESTVRRVGMSVVTDYVARVLEVFRDTNQLNRAERLRVSLHGGHLTVGDTEFRTHSGMPTLSSGQDLILFLELWRAADAFSPAYGPYGVFAMMGNLVLIPRSLGPYEAFGGAAQMPKEEFVDALRRARCLNP